ncbi:hypothetical protein BJ878DRAFT_398049, partial [Calycina marina]
MTCHVCSFATCSHHRSAWHTDMTCAKYDKIEELKERAAQSKASEDEISKTVKRCP